MPLFTYKCTNCEHTMEKFQHDGTVILDLICPLCQCAECERLMPDVTCRIYMESRRLLDEKILPSINEIEKRVNKGSDRDFFDLTGESD